MTTQAHEERLATRLAFGFLAGFLATIVFHQLVVVVLWALGIAPFPPFQMAPTRPFGVPAVVSLAFWGGVWGLAFALLEPRLPRDRRYPAMAFLFGAILPSAVALLVVLPLKGRPLGGGWQPGLLATAFLANGAWGVGTALILRKALGR